MDTPFSYVFHPTPPFSVCSLLSGCRLEAVWGSPARTPQLDGPRGMSVPSNHHSKTFQLSPELQVQLPTELQ